MINNKMFIFHATDYQNYPIGGTIGTIRNFFKYTIFDCVLIGLTSNPQVKLGEWQKINVFGKKFDFLPIALSRNEVIPHKILMLIGTIIYRKKILEKCDSDTINAMFYVDRQCYTALKYIVASGKQINSFYKMTDATNPLKTSGRMVSKIKFLQKIYFDWFFRPLLLDSSMIFSINDECHKFCEQTLLSTEQRQKIVDLNHFVDFNRLYELYRNAKMESKTYYKRLIFWGRIVQVKGLELIIESVQRLCGDGEKFECLVIGDGEERGRLEKIVCNLDLSDRIMFLGRKNIDEIAALSKNADLFVMSSYSEGVPTSMLEAMVFGLPIVSTSVGGVPNLVSPRVNGYLLDDRSVESYARAIRNALELDREHAEKYGRDLIKKSYSAESIVSKMDTLIMERIK